MMLKQSHVAIATLFAWSALATVANTQPTNSAPNPYNTIEGWAKMPEGRAWGSTSAVDIDKDGVSIWVAERCAANSCLNSALDPIMKFDATGKMVASFGRGMFIFPHGIHVDKDGNIWVTDGQDNLPRAGRGAAAGAPPPPPPAKIVGHQIYKFSPKGELLMTLGKAGGAKGADFFFQPNDVITTPKGEIIVVEGHSSSDSANARIMKFDKTGKLLKTWGAADLEAALAWWRRLEKGKDLLAQGNWLDHYLRHPLESGIYPDRIPQRAIATPSKPLSG